LAKQDTKKYLPDLLPAGTTVDIVKFDLKMEFVGLKSMLYGDWKKMKKQAGFTYRAYQQGKSSFNK